MHLGTIHFIPLKMSNVRICLCRPVSVRGPSLWHRTINQFSLFLFNSDVSPFPFAPDPTLLPYFTRSI